MSFKTEIEQKLKKFDSMMSKPEHVDQNKWHTNLYSLFDQYWNIQCRMYSDTLLLKIKAGIKIIKDLKMVINFIQKYDIFLRNPACRLLPHGEFLNRWLIGNNIRILLCEIKHDMIKYRTFEYFKIIDKEIELKCQDQKFIVNHARNIKILYEYIDHHAKSEFPIRVRDIELIARLCYNAGCIDAEFKDKCYCVKDEEQYTRYITYIRNLENVEKLNEYMKKKTNEILNSEEFYLRYINFN